MIDGDDGDDDDDDDDSLDPSVIYHLDLYMLCCRL
jgi:hypothetical protein